MATLTIRDLDDELRDQLRVRAAEHGRSMEAEVRAILRESLAKHRASGGLGRRIHRRFGPIDAPGLDLPARTERPRTPVLPD